MTTILQSPSLINDFADFLSQGPSSEQIIEWRPSPPILDRYLELTEKRKEDRLTSEEERELESFLNSEIVLSLVKARLRSTSRKHEP